MNKLLFVCLFLLAPVSLASADLKVAVIDLSKAFEQYYKTKDAQAALKVKQDGYQKEIQDQINTYQHMGDEAQLLDKGANDQTLSQQARADKASALQAKKQDLVNLGNKIKEMEIERKRELDEELLQKHQQILSEISKVINDYSTPQGFDLVIDKSNVSAASGISIVLFNSNKLTDITTPIITILNKSAPAGGTTPAAGTTPTASAPPTP